MLRVELPQSARRSEVHAPESVQGNGSFIDTLISLLCGILCNNEQYNKTVGKTSSSICIYFILQIIIPYICNIEKNYLTMSFRKRIARLLKYFVENIKNF